MVAIVRLDKNTIEVDTIIFKKVREDWYEAKRDCYKDLRVYDNYILMFLKIEEEDRVKSFNDALEDILYENNISKLDINCN